MLENRRNLGGGKRLAELLNSFSRSRKLQTRGCGYGI